MRKIGFIFGLFWLMACGSDPIPSPQTATLQSPANMESCTTASPVNPQQSVVEFNWGDADDTDSYTLFIENLSTQARTQVSVSVSEARRTLARGIAYRWWVESLSEASSESATSEKWVFYLEGEATAQHLPFPADLIFPAEDGQVNTDTVEFQWTGSDIDEDIAHYNLLLGSSADELVIVASEVTDNRYSASVNANSTYYWQVVTVDAQGNRSYSGINRFQTL